MDQSDEDIVERHNTMLDARDAEILVLRAKIAAIPVGAISRLLDESEGISGDSWAWRRVEKWLLEQ